MVYFLAKYADLTVNGQSQAILTVLVFGAGTDYALLLVARYREELRRHEDRHEAMAFALHRAAPGDLRQRRRRSIARHALPDARRDELHAPASARSSAIGVAVTLLVMVTLLPGPAGDLRPLGVLAQAARLRLPRAHHHGLLGPGRPADRSAAPRRSGW